MLVAVLEDGLGRLGFSDLSLKDEQHLSIRAISSILFLLTLGRAYVIKSSIPFMMEHQYNQLDASKTALAYW